MLLKLLHADDHAYGAVIHLCNRAVFDAVGGGSQIVHVVSASVVDVDSDYAHVPVAESRARQATEWVGLTVTGTPDADVDLRGGGHVGGDIYVDDFIFPDVLNCSSY